MLECPHCHAIAEDNALFCASCGKAVSTGYKGPRVVEATGMASTGVGVALQKADLEKKSRQAFTCLLVVGIVQFLAALAILAANLNPIVPTTIAIIGVIFLGLAFWARRSPLPAAVTGLVLLVTL